MTKDQIAEMTDIFINNRQISVTHFYSVGPDRFSIGYWSGEFYFQGVWSWGLRTFTKVS